MRYALLHKGEQFEKARTMADARVKAHRASVSLGWRVVVVDTKLKRRPVVLTWVPVPDLKVIMALWSKGMTHYNVLLN